MIARTESPETPDFTTYIANRKFHQSFQLPPNKTQGRDHSSRITYADYGYHNDEAPGTEAMILVCGPMMGTRYLHIAKDALARKHKVRIIHPDRFGFGGSFEVDADERVKMWLALLKHLNIQHVSIMAQSGGTIYALNTILYLRHLLHPTNPYLALGAPWVHPSHSGATAMQLMKIFPNAVLDHLDSVAHWFRNNVMPVTGFSENIIGTLGASIDSLLSPKTPIAEPIAGDAGGHGKVSAEDEAAFVFDEEVRPVAVNLAYAENIQGLSQEALLFLKRGKVDAWGPWKDYDAYVPILAAAEKEYRKTSPGAEVGSEAEVAMKRLKIDVFYAETDVMIGNSAGPKWMDECWRREGVHWEREKEQEEEQGRDEYIEYHSVVVKGADHDGIFNMRWGAVQKVFAEVGSRSS